MIDHVGIYGSRVAEGLSAFNVGLVFNGNHAQCRQCTSVHIEDDSLSDTFSLMKQTMMAHLTGFGWQLQPTIIVCTDLLSSVIKLENYVNSVFGCDLLLLD